MKYYITVRNMREFLNQYNEEDLISFCNIDSKNVCEFCMKPSTIFPTKLRLGEYEKLINYNKEELKDNDLTVIDFTFKNTEEDTFDEVSIHKICKIGNEISINNMVNKLSNETGIDIKDIDECLGLD